MKHARRRLPILFVIVGLALGGATASAQQTADEDQARRQLDSGRAFAKQGNFAEALRDFRVVAETYASSSVADNALLEIARYYLDVAGDPNQAIAAVETILKRYPTSDSAPDAYLITGRLAMMKSHQPGDLDTALANFDRVPRLFPTAAAVPHALVLAAEAHWLSGRYDEALTNLVRVEVEYASNPVTATAHLHAAQVLVSRGDPISAMEELQQVRNRWPGSPEAEIALGRLTVLHRLYIRAKAGPAYSLTPEAPGPARLQNIVGMSSTPQGAVYWASETNMGLLTSQKAPPPLSGVRSKGLTIDRSGNIVAIEAGGLRPIAGNRVPLVLPRPTGAPVPIEKIEGAVQLYNGDWLVMDDDPKLILRFNRAGEYVSQFSNVRVTKMAVNGLDEVAAFDREQRGVVVFDGAGTVIGRIAAKGTGYDLANPEALAFDAFGHLYVLDRAVLAVFAPGPPGPKRTYTLMTAFTEPATNPTAFRRATAFALDASGGLYLYDERAQKVQVYR